MFIVFLFLKILYNKFLLYPIVTYSIVTLLYPIVMTLYTLSVVVVHINH